MEPRTDRKWKPEYSRQPTASVFGDEVIVKDLRDFDWRTEREAVERWIEKRVHLSSLRGLDIFVSHWGNPWIAHALLSFDFGDEGRLAASIETRQEVGEGYSAIRGFFRQYEIIYMLAEEGDVIRLRTDVRSDETVQLYRTKMTPEDSRSLFLAYLGWMNENAKRADWYNALTNHCTTPYSNWMLEHRIGGFSRWDWRLTLNGKGDEMLYELGLLETRGLSFAELRKRSTLTRGFPREGFSLRIRQAIGMSQEFAAPIR
jgi:hypothetical protein